MGNYPRVGWQGIIAPPDSPAGGGGPGGFRSALPVGGPNLVPLLITVKIVQSAANLWLKTRSMIGDLSRVDFLGKFDTTGLKGDWHELDKIWILETSPASMGTWSVEEGVPLVAITSKEYISDLQTKPNYQETLNKFKQEHPDIDRINVGDLTINHSGFTGTGSASGKYNALDWFMGNYKTTVTVTSKDLKTKSVKVRIEVSNTSRWQSATRMPQSFVDKGVWPYLKKDAPRKAFGPGGTFKQKFTWEDTIQFD